ncbi:ABC transporter ATP-binding protein [Natrarchaeobius halalkaliphilus]|uniref:ABC transporter ATP-binding protein n=1 Tax=Natrarchaeobius halalkaliphilus TaxID=1679091 RepID=A0A3N6LHV4_9EURY|nr:ABC transporter ATP-binding protein [Natrarchaeobius halalkaliphilus]
MLEASDVDAGYGQVEILDEIAFEVPEGEILSIIGPNGAGKTTLMRVLMGLIPARSGSVELQGGLITDRPTHERVKMGMSLVTEKQNLFTEMTVAENLKLGSYTARGDEKEKRLERVFKLFPRLEERQSQHAGTLSGGEARMLALGRSLMTDLDILLLDEPSIGLAPHLIPELFEKIREINDRGVSIVLVEQRAQEALELADSGCLLENGCIVHRDDASAMLDSDEVIEQYLGGA